MKKYKRIAIYLMGLAVLTCGQRLFVEAGLGAGAFDSTCVGLSQWTMFSAGTWVTIGSFVLMLLSALLERRRPNLWVMLSSFVFGLLFDGWGQIFARILPDAIPLIGQILLYVVAILLAPLGTAIYFTTDISKSAYDEIIVALQTACKVPIWLSKTIVEGTMLLLGSIVRGPIGVTTIVTAFAFGPLLQKYMNFLECRNFRALQWKQNEKEC